MATRPTKQIMGRHAQNFTARGFDYDPARLRLTRIASFRGNAAFDSLIWTTAVSEDARRLDATLQKTQATVDALNAVGRDRDLSQSGQEKKMREVASRFLDELKYGAISLRDRVLEALDWIPRLPPAPAVENTAAAIALDTELRSAFRQVDSEKMIGPLIGGQHPELLAALVRGPLFLSGLDEKQFAKLRRGAIANHQREILELAGDASFLLKQFDAAVGGAFSAVCDAARRSIDLPRPSLLTAKVRALDEMLAGHGIGEPLNPQQWLEASISVSSKSPEIEQKRIAAANEARRAALREGQDHVEAERRARSAADAVVDPDEREPEAA